MRESSTGAKAGTFPKDGENIRSSELSENLAQETRREEEGRCGMGSRSSHISGVIGRIFSHQSPTNEN